MTNLILKGIQGQHRGKIFTLDRDRSTIGSKKGAHIKITHADVLDAHAIIAAGNILTPIGRVAVNTKVITQPVELKPGDGVQIKAANGKIIHTFKVETNAHSSLPKVTPGTSANPMLVRPEDILRGPPPLPPQARAPARKSKGNEQPEFSASPNDSFAAPSVKRELVELRRTRPDSKASKFLKNEFIKNVDGKWFAIRGKSETKKTAEMLMNRVDRLLARIAQRKLKNNGEIYSDNSKKTDLITCMFPRLGWAIPAKWLSDMAGVKTEAIFHYEDRPDSYDTLAGVHIKPPGNEFNIPGGLRRKFGTAEWIVPARDRYESLSPNYIHMVEFDGEHLEPDDLETIRDSIALHSLISYASSKPYEKRLGTNQKIDKLQKAILTRFQEHLNATKSKPR